MQSRSRAFGHMRERIPEPASTSVGIDEQLLCFEASAEVPCHECKRQLLITARAELHHQVQRQLSARIFAESVSATRQKFLERAGRAVQCSTVNGCVALVVD